MENNKTSINLHKTEITEFELEYIMQTRREIDTEKQERNKLFNYAILATSAFTLAIAQIEKSTEFLTKKGAFAFYIPLLILISSIVATRQMKLRQISDRWLTIYEIILKRNIAKDWKSLEEIVVEGLKGKRYILEDLLLHFGLSIIVYSLMLTATIRINELSFWIISIIIIIIHIITTLLLFLRPIKINEYHKNLI